MLIGILLFSQHNYSVTAHHAHVILIHTTTGTSVFLYAYLKVLVPVVVCIRNTCAYTDNMSISVIYTMTFFSFCWVHFVLYLQYGNRILQTGSGYIGIYLW